RDWSSDVCSSDLPPYRTAASVASVCVGDAEVLERLVRAAVPLRHDGVAHVAQILDADLRGPESRGDEIAEPVEECHTRLHRLRRARRPRNVIQDRGL